MTLVYYVMVNMLQQNTVQAPQGEMASAGLPLYMHAHTDKHTNIYFWYRSVLHICSPSRTNPLHIYFVHSPPNHMWLRYQNSNWWLGHLQSFAVIN